MCFSHEPIIKQVKPSTIIHTEAHTDNAITQNRKLCEVETIQVMSSDMCEFSSSAQMRSIHVTCSFEPLANHSASEDSHPSVHTGTLTQQQHIKTQEVQAFQTIQTQQQVEKVDGK